MVTKPVLDDSRDSAAVVAWLIASDSVGVRLPGSTQGGCERSGPIARVVARYQEGVPYGGAGRVRVRTYLKT